MQSHLAYTAATRRDSVTAIKRRAHRPDHGAQPHDTQACSATLLLTFALFTGQASAVEYVPPVGTGWWQLLTNDGKFTEVCAQFAGPCNPEPGSYILLDFATSPATRTLVSIEEPTEPGSSKAPKLYIATVGGVGSNGADGATEAEVTCPEGKVVVGGACYARSLSNGDPIIPAYGGIVDLDIRRTYACRTDEPAFVIVAEATCY